MMNADDQKDKLKKICNELVETFDNKQKHHTKLAEDYGYARETISFIDETMAINPDDSSLNDNVDLLVRFNKVIKAMPDENVAGFDVTSGTYTLASTVTSTATGSIDRGFIDRFLENRSPPPPPARKSNHTELYAKRLDRLDPELGKTYRSVWETFYGTTNVPERTSLGSMRQTIDHFFSIFGPDKEVRASPYFSKKEGPEPNQIHRIERIKYVAYTHIANNENAELLLSEEKNILKHYKKLNKLHKRGEVNRNETRQTLISMTELLHQWIDAIDLS